MPKISIISRLADFISPRQCPICGGRLCVMEEDLCAVCNYHLPRTGHYENPTDNEMARLFYGKIPIERCAALVFYESRSQANNLIYKLKYYGSPEVGETLGRLLAEELERCGFFESMDVIVPLPLARVRERQRGYNQSEKIARGIRSMTRLPIERKAVRRLSFSESQTHLEFRERMENVEGAFELVDARSLTGKHVLIVDDVVTTGATVTACARQILRAGDVKISIASVAFTRN